MQPEPKYVLYASNGQPERTYSQRDLYKAAAEGHIHPDAKLQEVGHPVFFKASDHPGLKKLIDKVSTGKTNPEDLQGIKDSFVQIPAYLNKELMQQYRKLTIWQLSAFGALLFGLLTSLFLVGFIHSFAVAGVFLPLSLVFPVGAIAGLVWIYTQKNAIRRKIAEFDADPTDWAKPSDDMNRRSSIIIGVCGIVLAAIYLGISWYVSDSRTVGQMVKRPRPTSPVVYQSTAPVYQHRSVITSVPPPPQSVGASFVHTPPVIGQVPVQPPGDDLDKLRSLQEQSRTADFVVNRANDRDFNPQPELPSLPPQRSAVIRGASRRVPNGSSTYTIYAPDRNGGASEIGWGGMHEPSSGR